MKIGERIRAHRRICGLSQKALADRSRMDPAQLNRYERGKVIPDLAQVIRLAKTLKVSVGDLV